VEASFRLRYSYSTVFSDGSRLETCSIQFSTRRSLRSFCCRIQLREHHCCQVERCGSMVHEENKDLSFFSEHDISSEAHHDL